MPDGGTLVLFIGGTTSANAKARTGGVLDELAGEKGAKGPQYGKYTLHKNEPITDGGDENKALENARTELDKLKDTPNLGAVGLYAYNPKAILSAAEKIGLLGKIKIVGFDEDDITLKGIETGQIVGTVVQDPFNYGYQSVTILAALAKGDKSKLPKPGEMIAYRLVTKDGGPDQTVNGTVVKNLKASDFAKQLKADIESAKK
jgi:ribose transport system substrate-binding protein